MYKIIFYDTEDGKTPVKDFIWSLDNKMKAKLLQTIDLLEERGSELREPYSKHLKDGILELRVKQGSKITRVLYFFVIGEKAVLTNGFMKKTQKTPKKEITLAKKYRDDYIRRFGNE